jgi:hypothetical protein
MWSVYQVGIACYEITSQWYTINKTLKLKAQVILNCWYLPSGKCSIMTQKTKESYLSYRIGFNYHSLQTSRVLKKAVLRSSETPVIADPVTAAVHLRRKKSSNSPQGKPHNLRNYCSYPLLWVQFDISLPLTNLFMWMSFQPLAQRAATFVSIPWLSSLCLGVASPLPFPPLLIIRSVPVTPISISVSPILVQAMRCA